jgi:hypothetical protein
MLQMRVWYTFIYGKYIYTRDTPLSTKVDTKFRRQVAVDQSV